MEIEDINRDFINFIQICKDSYVYYFLFRRSINKEFSPQSFDQTLKRQIFRQNRNYLPRYYYITNDSKFILKDIVNITSNYTLNEQQQININDKFIRTYLLATNTPQEYYEIGKKVNSKYQYNMYGYTVAMWLTVSQYLIPRKWMHDFNIKDKKGRTLKDLMIENHMPIPQECDDINKMSIFDQAYFAIIPDIMSHQPDEQNEDGFTVAMILALNNIQIPKCWEHRPEIQNKYGWTIAMIQAKNYKIPDKQWQHQPQIQNKNLMTVAMLLMNNRIFPPNQWEHDSALKDINGNTMAMYQALKYKIPFQQWQHDPTIQNNQGMTVAMQLAKQHINPPKEWQHQPQLQNSQGYTVAMYIAQYCKRIPPKEWEHDSKIQNQFGSRVNDYLEWNNILVPEYWKISYNKNISEEDRQYINDYFNYYRIGYKNYYITQIYNDNEEQNTLAMYLAKKSIIPSQQWYHDPKKTNKYGETVAMLLAQNKIIPPKEWQHEPEIQDNCGWTVAMQLANQGIIPPKQWHHDPTMQEYLSFDTVAMRIALGCKQIPSIDWHHDPLIQNKYNQTVALILACYAKQIPPQEWWHDPKLKNEFGSTVQDYLVKNNIDVQEQWLCFKYDNLSEQNKLIIKQYCQYNNIKLTYNINPEFHLIEDDNTIAMWLANKGIVPPKIFIHGDQIKNNYHQTIDDLLQKHDYLYKDNQYVFKYKTQIVNNICQICFNEGEQEFMITKCGHQICFKCLKKLLYQKNDYGCPICRQKDWIEKNYSL